MVKLKLAMQDELPAIAWFAPAAGGATKAVAIEPTAEIEVALPSRRALNFTVVYPRDGTRVELVGTATVVLAPDPAAEAVTEATAPLVASPRSTRTTALVVTAPPGVCVEAVNPARAASKRCRTLVETTWHEPVCVAEGVESLRPVRLTDAGVRRLARRWARYTEFAASTTPSADNPAVLLPLIVGAAGGTYHRERKDRRGVADLSFCTSDDCDGMAWSAVAFYGQVMEHALQLGRLPPFAGQNVIGWARRRYPSAIVTYGKCRSPINGKPFFHAWFNLVAVPRDAMRPWSRLTDEQHRLLAAAGVTPQQWAAGDADDRPEWVELTGAARAANEALGYTEPMWDVQRPKLHGEATGVVAVFEEGAVPNDEVNRKIKEIRTTKTFKQTSTIMTQDTRYCPKQYLYVTEIHGPYYARELLDTPNYADFINRWSLGPRHDARCCDRALVGRQAVFVERTDADAAVGGIEPVAAEVRHRTIQRSPQVWFLSNPEGPFAGEIPADLQKSAVFLDPFVQWAMFQFKWADHA